MSEELGDDCLAEMAMICALKGNLVGIDTLDELRVCVLKLAATSPQPLERENVARALYALDCHDANEERRKERLPIPDKWADPWLPTGIRQLEALRRRADVFIAALAPTSQVQPLERPTEPQSIPSLGKRVEFDPADVGFSLLEDVEEAAKNHLQDLIEHAQQIAERSGRQDYRFFMGSKEAALDEAVQRVEDQKRYLAVQPLERETKPRRTIFARPECVFHYCPHPKECAAYCGCPATDTRPAQSEDGRPAAVAPQPEGK